MISDRELWACAHAVMEFHGERVGDYLYGRIRAMSTAKDHDGLGTWLAIASRVGELHGGEEGAGALH